MKNLQDLLDFNRFQIQNLQNKVCQLESKVTTLTGYCFEALDEDCPEEYKIILKQEIYTLNQL